MLKALAGNYQNFRPSDNPDQAIAYTGAIERMVGEFGQGRTAAAIQKAIDYVPDFVPTSAKLREFVPSPGGKLTTCTLCHQDEGYVRVFHGWTTGGNPIDPTGAVRRCDHVGGNGPVTGEHHYGRTYGKMDIQELWKIHKARRLKEGKPLREDQLEWCLGELDKRINAVEGMIMPQGKK